MINIFSGYHLIKNFPKKYSFHKKILANVIFFFTGIIIHPRKNELTPKDLIKARLTLKMGDIILAGNLRTILHTLIREPVTHSGLYVGDNRFIHSRAEGVQYISLYKIFLDYDTLVILRVPDNVNNREEIIENTIRYAKSQYGMPYDFGFKAGAQSFFCTELVNESFKSAGFKTGLSSLRRSKSNMEKLRKHFSGAIDALHPVNFIKSKFDIVYLSHNLNYINGKLLYQSKISFANRGKK